MRKLAVTGGLASGKSSVCRILKRCGAYVVSADEIVHQLLSHDQTIIQQVISALGSDIVKDHQIDRGIVAKKVFSHPKKLKTLESILHPAVFREIENLYERIKHEKSHDLFVAEIPLLYESDAEKFYDAVIVVHATPEHCKQRVHKAKGLSYKDFDQRMERQWPLHHKMAMAHYTINNDSDLETLNTKVIQLYPLLQGALP